MVGEAAEAVGAVVEAEAVEAAVGTTDAAADMAAVTEAGGS